MRSRKKGGGQEGTGSRKKQELRKKRMPQAHRTVRRRRRAARSQEIQFLVPTSVQYKDWRVWLSEKGDGGHYWTLSLSYFFGQWGRETQLSERCGKKKTYVHLDGRSAMRRERKRPRKGIRDVLSLSLSFSFPLSLSLSLSLSSFSC